MKRLKMSNIPPTLSGCVKKKSCFSAIFHGQRIKIHPPGTFDISSVQYNADPEVWQIFVSQLRAVGLQLTQLHPRDQIVLYYTFAEELEKKKNGEK